MSAVILGSPTSGQKTLRRNEFSTQRNGLEFINEIYTIRTADRATIQPPFETLHKNYSTASTKYARMAVENVAFKEIDGDLTEMTVSYVGLTSASGLPPALVRIIPAMDKGVFGPPCVINVEYISDQDTAKIISGVPGGAVLGLGSRRQVPMPKSINGTELPRNPRDPFSTGSQPFQPSLFFKPGAYTVFGYQGYVLNSIQAEERGIFVVVVAEYAEYSETTLVG
jgi:hypothetical protein